VLGAYSCAPFPPLWFLIELLWKYKLPLVNNDLIFADGFIYVSVSVKLLAIALLTLFFTKASKIVG
jgi:hypothetical protein